MNKNAIKEVAIAARKSLLKQIEQMLAYLKVDEPDKLPVKMSAGSKIEDVEFKSGEKFNQRAQLIKRIKDIDKEQVIEEVAYTWFNRFIALRFMEVNGYLESGVRILSSEDSTKKEPQIITDVLSVKLPINKEKVYAYQDSNDTEGLYKYLVILQCNELHKQLPFLFEQINDYTELLFPENLLHTESFIRDLVNEIDEADWKEVEIIGWLYQYYIFDKKDKLIKAKKKYKTEDIPAVTQLFTSKWIVRYMVQNSLGRYWVEAHPEKAKELKKSWEFYLDPRDDETRKKIEELKDSGLKVEDIKVFDPAMGSGHILVYAFEVLYEIYKSQGFVVKDIPRQILERNLYGLDIDKRAVQLAQFALLMKARQYDSRILTASIELNLFEIVDSKHIADSEIESLVGSKGEDFNKIKEVVSLFEDAKTLGSIIKIQGCDVDWVEKYLETAKNENDLFASSVFAQLKTFMPQLKLLSMKYDVVIANPPYISGRYMNDDLSSYIKTNYAENKSDLFAVFIEIMIERTKDKGQLGVMSPFVWMFIQSYQNLRELIVSSKSISTLIQLEVNAFESACVQICTFSLRNYSSDIAGEYIKLSDFKGSENQPKKSLEAITNPDAYYRYTANTRDFKKISGSPIAYWVSERVREIYKNGKSLAQICKPTQGLATGDNDLFRRNWQEVEFSKIGLNGYDSSKKWFPYNSGGKYRKWYGNQDYVINWQDDGDNIRNFNGSVVRNPTYYFKECISWSKVTSGGLALRYIPKGFIFDVAGCSIFGDKDKIMHFLGLLNSKLKDPLIASLSPTLNFEVGQIANTPFLDINEKIFEEIHTTVKENISISKADWDSFEKSWEFEEFPMISMEFKVKTVRESYLAWVKKCKENVSRMKELEEKSNKLFIDAYGMKDELTPEISSEQTTLFANPKYRYRGKAADDELEQRFKEDTMKEFISYSVGCMMGRYSLDQKGLVYAYSGNEGFDMSKYKTFPADEDGIIPVLDDDYFEDDIVARFVEFVKVTFGKETLSENLEFIAKAIGKTPKEKAIDRLRKYFFNDFYKDHVQTYKKRPIYWMISSGKQKAFNALIYLHRYNKGTIAKVRTDYLHELQGKIELAIGRQQKLKESVSSSSEKIKADKMINEFKKKQEELRKFDEQLRHYADKQIDIDLDDGVKVNYPKFKDILVDIKL